MIKVNGVEVKPTIFPDGTSQIWKLDLDAIFSIHEKANIVWYYEQEVELIWLNQLVELFKSLDRVIPNIFIPYLPYGRQDKKISNESTFAKNVFLKMLPEISGEIITLDIHSKVVGDIRHVWFLTSIEPEKYIMEAITHFSNYPGDSNVALVYPDKGAYDRYSHLFEGLEYIVMDKVRNQITGKIESLKIDKETTSFDISGKFVNDNVPKFLIVDDISDYGGTFKMVARTMKEICRCDIALYVTHYLGHGGSQQLYDSGISKIYTSNSLSEYRKSKNLDDSRVIDVTLLNY
jgi:phosphoribosylpyrophosphate synthetase